MAQSGNSSKCKTRNFTSLSVGVEAARHRIKVREWGIDTYLGLSRVEINCTSAASEVRVCEMNKRPMLCAHLIRYRGL